MTIETRFIVGRKFEALEKSAANPDILYIAVRRYKSRSYKVKGKAHWGVSLGDSAAFGGRAITLGPRQLDVLVLISIHGSATNRDIVEAMTAYEEDGGPAQPSVRANQVRTQLTAKLGWLGLDIESYFDVDPQRPRYRLRRLDRNRPSCPNALDSMSI